MEETAVGHAFDGYFGWHYPPTFLFVAAALSLLPYAAAYALWAFATFPAYLVAIRAIIGDRVGYLLAAAFPAVLPNFIVGQNGFLTAGLIGGALFLLEGNPVAAGILLGLLTYKPHLGLLFPIALAAGGYWRAFFTAAAVALLMAAASWLAFGSEAWLAFLGNIGHTSQAFLSEGWADWSKLQTAFGLTRTLGGSETLAWIVQAAVLLSPPPFRSRSSGGAKRPTISKRRRLASARCWRRPISTRTTSSCWRCRSRFCSGSPMRADTCPRTCQDLPKELIGIGIACGLILIFPFVKFPVGLAALLLIAALVARRLFLPRERRGVSGSAIVQPKIAIAPNPDAARVIALVGLTLALCYLVVLCSAFLGGNFLIDAHGEPIANDFVNVWAAGRLALEGNAAAAYDWTLHKAAEVRAVGHDFANYYGWHYPPTFLFVAAALATLPYLAAAIVWLACDARTLRGDARQNPRRARRRCGRARLSGGAVECHGRAERLLHGGADRRHALLLGTAASACGHLPWPADLQAAIRSAVSDRADRGSALADDRRRCRSRARTCRTRVARFRHGQLARFLRGHVGDKPRGARRRRRRFEQTAECVRPCPRARRQRDAGVERASGRCACRRRGARRAVAKPGGIRTQGRGAWPAARCSRRLTSTCTIWWCSRSPSLFCSATPCSGDFQVVDGAALTAAAALILVYPYAPTQVGLAATLIVAALTAFRACCIATRIRVRLAASTNLQDR